MKKTLFAMAMLTLVGAMLCTGTAEARFRKPMYVCTGTCPNGGNSVKIYQDNDADANYDKCTEIDCDGHKTVTYGDWPSVTGDGGPTSGLTITDWLNPETSIYAFHAVYAPSSAVYVVIDYDGSDESGLN